MAVQTLCVAWLTSKSPSLSDDPQVCWGLYSDLNPSSVLKYTPLSEVREQLPEYLTPESLRVLAIVPGEEILITPMNVPTARSRYIDRALPYMLEEQLLEPLENYFIAHQKIAKSKEFPVAAVSHEKMGHWINTLQEIGLSPDYLLPDVLVVPHEPGRINVFVDQERGVIRGDDWRCTACEINQLSFYTQVLVNDLKAANEEDEETDEIQDLAEPEHEDEDEDEDIEFEAGGSTDLDVQILYPKKGIDLDRKVARTVRSLNETNDQNFKAQALYLPKSYHILLFESALQQVKENSAFQLLQQRYRPESKQNNEKNKKIPAVACLIILLFSLHCVHLVMKSHHFRALADEQAETNLTYYKELFPGDAKVRRIKRQMQAHLKNRSGGQALHFLHYYQTIGENLTQAQGRSKGSIKINRFNFDRKQSEARLDLLVKDYPFLDTFKTKLEANKMDVKIENATKDGDWVKARVKVRPSESAS